MSPEKLDTVLFSSRVKSWGVIQMLPWALPKVTDHLLPAGACGYVEKNWPLWGQVFKESITVENRRGREVRRLEAIARHEIHPSAGCICSSHHELSTILGLENTESKLELETELKFTLKRANTDSWYKDRRCFCRLWRFRWGGGRRGGRQAVLDVNVVFGGAPKPLVRKLQRKPCASVVSPRGHLVGRSEKFPLLWKERGCSWISGGTVVSFSLLALLRKLFRFLFQALHAESFYCELCICICLILTQTLYQKASSFTQSLDRRLSQSWHLAYLLLKAFGRKEQIFAFGSFSYFRKFFLTHTTVLIGRDSWSISLQPVYFW